MNMQKVYVLIKEEVASNGSGGFVDYPEIIGVTSNHEEALAFEARTDPNFDQEIRKGGIAIRCRYEEHLLSN